jgi:hypothetical protein
VSALRQNGPSLDLGPDDYGVLTIGGVAFFFQHVRAAKKPGWSMVFDGTFWASQALSAFVSAAFGGMMFLAHQEADNPDALELPTDLITRFMVTIVPGRGQITRAPADRAIHPADQRDAIGARYRPVPGMIAIGPRHLIVG